MATDHCTSCTELQRQLTTPTNDYKGLKAGDEITVQWTDSVTIPGAIVTATCEYGARVRCPKPATGTFDMYVRHQNRHGHWHA